MALGGPRRRSRCTRRVYPCLNANEKQTRVRERERPEKKEGRDVAKGEREREKKNSRIVSKSLQGRARDDKEQDLSRVSGWDRKDSRGGSKKNPGNNTS